MNFRAPSGRNLVFNQDLRKNSNKICSSVTDLRPSNWTNNHYVAFQDWTCTDPSSIGDSTPLFTTASSPSVKTQKAPLQYSTVHAVPPVVCNEPGHAPASKAQDVCSFQACQECHCIPYHSFRHSTLHSEASRSVTTYHSISR